ncbi:MAG: esterase-like activity of phytase family protein [Bosea sp.]|uniref:esterase-like activity of phytase family protein n=3 Tax=Bosea TaxID=85413 RepID=UPI00096759EE|nr:MULTISPECIES: esterase-like activity of phytase family protein [unclassified Bosea (in: a-proteobacteria)]MBN9457835.1 esterase-like activity of phytase family protein [Bosea sp. (in: a-proteobacteria)]OJV10382.1 MAG: glycerophosphodiester phosphodiesterase [Bosea sp. 67-29]
MRASLAVALLLSSTMLAGAETPQKEFPAKFLGQALLPAATIIPAPADAPADLRVSGKFVTPGKRVEAVGSVTGTSGGRPTGLSTPFAGQPVQGFSGIRSLGNGEFLVLTDNGFGAKANSPDAMLFFHRLRADFEKGVIERLSTTFLRDPDKKIPFRIVHEGTQQRYLTGADFDPESIQPIGGKYWIGEEFGPYLIRVDADGKVEAVFETQVDGKPARSPDHYAVTTPGAPEQSVVFNIRRSNGFEGMAQSPDGRFLYPLLEGPFWNAEARTYEERDGKAVLRILEFDVANEKWTGRSWFFPLEQKGNAIGDFNMIDATTALVIERDNGEGTADRACPAGQKGPDCFHDLARFKRIVKIEMTDANVGKPVRRIGYVDLMKIADPDGKAKQGSKDGVFTFPFFTIENVDVVDRANGVIVVGNDNNLPFSSSRDPKKADDDELVLLSVKELLDAK